MSTARSVQITTAIAALAAAGLVLSACSSSSPLEPAPSAPSAEAGEAIVIGSQAYYSNEIIAEIYAQALEGAGLKVERKFNIGQRDAYVPELEAGNIDLFPEYTGNLLQWFDPDTTARTSEAVFAALPAALPANLVVLDQAPATDQDSYSVLADFAAEHSLKSIGDLASVTVPLTLGGAPELAERPYGPKGLAEIYGVNVTFSATGDTTVEDLVAGTVNIANVYTPDPRIQTEGLVVLADPKGLFLASHVVPVVNASRADEIAPTINAVSKALTQDALVQMNVQSTEGKQSAKNIAAQFLQENNLA